MIYNSITMYLTALYEWKNYPAKIRKGIMYVLFNGDWVPNSEFAKLSPMPKYEPAMKCNPDGSKVGNPYPSKDKRSGR